MQVSLTFLNFLIGIHYAGDISTKPEIKGVGYEIMKEQFD